MKNWRRTSSEKNRRGNAVSIQPIDLQTLFMRLNQVGKEQAAQKEAAHVAQEAQGSEIAKRSQDQSHSVNETKDLEEGLEGVKDGEQGGEETEEGSEEQSQKDEADKAKRKVFQDPALGTKIDISG
jgi:hypothetical protein